MKLLFVNMIMLLSVSIAALSCSTGAPYDDTMTEGDGPYTIVVSGTASDKSSGTPLKEIRISLHAAEMIIGGEKEVRTTNVYTDINGHFTLTADKFSRPVSCTITASDGNGVYRISRQELNISWSGTSFDEYTGYFYVNDCNFYMEPLLK